MSRLAHILAATDFSTPARRATERAALLAKQSGASLDLVHVASLDAIDELRRLVADVEEEAGQRMLDDARQELGRLAAALERTQGVPATTKVASGRLLAEVVDLANRVSADLIVLGARGASFMRHLVLGSTAERLLARVARPMLVVKQAAHGPYRSVLIPVDFSPHAATALRLARAVAPHAHVVLLHAYEVPFDDRLRFAGVDERIIARYRSAAEEEALRKLRALYLEAAWLGDNVELQALPGPPASRIIEVEQEFDCDLIVMARQGGSIAQDLLLGSVTRRVLAESQADVLVSA